MSQRIQHGIHLRAAMGGAGILRHRHVQFGQCCVHVLRKAVHTVHLGTVLQHLRALAVGGDAGRVFLLVLTDTQLQARQG